MTLMTGNGSLDPRYGVTPLGKRLQWMRMNRGERLYDMANKLGIGSAELSAYEFGKKRMGGELLGKIISVYELDNTLSMQLIQMANEAPRYNRQQGERR